MIAACPQGSPEWFAARAGRATASEFETILKEGRAKGTPSVGRQKYAMRLAIERITGSIEEQGEFAATKHGHEFEPLARMAYEAKSGNIVDEVGFVQHEILMVGSSPDGLIDDDGGLEIKCPANRDVHALTLRYGMPNEHIGQVQGNLWVTNRKWWDFVSYNPNMPEGLKLYIQRIERDDDYIESLELSVTKFCDEVDALVEFYKKLTA